MSLINQVLQDLDRRHADATALPAATHRVVAARAHERPRLLAGAAGAALIVVAIAAASALLWRQVDAHSAISVAEPAPTVAMPAPRPRAPGDELDFAAIAQVGPATFMVMLPGDASASAAVDLAPPTATAIATARANDSSDQGPATVSGTSPAASLATRPVRAALASRDEPISATSSPVQLEKSTPSLSPAERADVEYRRGIELHEHARAGDAEAAFAAALKHDDRHVSARRALAVEWIGRGQVQDAERVLAEGLALNAQQPQLAVVLARIQAERRDLRAGIETLRASLGGSAALPADQAEALALMATLQQSNGQHREAVDAFAAALRQVPQNGPWWIGLGLSLAAEGRGANAREAFERARATGTLTPELLLFVEQRLRTTTP